MLSKPGLSSQTNQDMVGGTNSAIWAFDGTTEVTPLQLQTNEDAVVWFVRDLNAYLQTNLDSLVLPIDEILTTAISNIKQKLKSVISESLDVDSLPLSVQPSAATAIARVRPQNHLELFLLGDCSIYIQTPPFALLLEEVEIKKVEHDFTTKLLKEKDNYPGLSHRDFLQKVQKRERIKELRLQLWEQNKFAVLNFNPAFIQRGIHFEIPFQSPTTILILTDGFNRLIDMYHVFKNYDELCSCLVEHGADRLYSLLRQTEESDPDAKKYPRMKLSDDASLIFATVD